MKINKLIIPLILALTILASSCASPLSPIGTDVPSPLESTREDETQITLDTTGVEIPSKTFFSFVAAGDNLIHESIFVDAQNRAVAASADGYSGKYYFDEMYNGVADIIKNAGLAFVNQEGPIAGDSLGVSGYPTFNAPEEAGDALIRLGFDIVNLANNHMLDMDTSKRAGYKGTIDFWKSKDILTVGGYESNEDYETVRVIEHSGIKIAILSYTYGVNGMKLSAASPGLVIPYINDSDITRQVKKAQSEADLVFVSMHWGSDTGGSSFNNQPTAEQKRLAQLLADLGVDVVIGHHPHVIQPICWLDGSGGGRTLVMYSLGNLISTMLSSFNNVGGLVSFNVVKDEDGKFSIEEPEFIPTVCHYTADASKRDSQGLATRSGLALYTLDNYTNELALAHGAQLEGSFTLDTLYGYVTQTISSEFLPDYLK